MVLKIFKIRMGVMLLIAEDEVITAMNAGQAYGYKFDEDLSNVSPEVLVLDVIRQNPYLQDPSETDKKRRFELVDDKSIREIVNSAI